MGDRSTPRGSPVAVGASFVAAGVLSASALSRMPTIRVHVHATSAQLSLALVCVGVGSLLSMPWTGRLTERFSSAVVTRWFGVVSVVGWAVLAFAPSVPVLAVFMLVLGSGVGTWDVGMNIQGHTVEQRHGRVLMPKWHALFSFGAVAGAAAGATFAKLGVPVEVHFPLMSAGALVLLLWSTRRFVPDAAHHADAHTAVYSATPSRSPAMSSGITRVEILLGVIVLCTALGEGAANDWLGLTLVDTRHVRESFGALALAGFNLTMGAGRLAGASVIGRIGRARALRVSGLIASSGVLLLCLVDSKVTALAGAAAWGIGLAIVFPSGMSAAGEVPGRGPRAIAAVSTVGYGGFLLGAPLIGQLSHVVALDRALLVVAVAGIVIAVLAPVARERSSERPGRVRAITSASSPARP